MFGKILALTTLLVSIGYLVKLGTTVNAPPDRVETVEVVHSGGVLMNVLSGEVYIEVGECALEPDQPVKIEEFRWFPREGSSVVTLNQEHVKEICEEKL